MALSRGPRPFTQGSIRLRHLVRMANISSAARRGASRSSWSHLEAAHQPEEQEVADAVRKDPG